MTGEPQPDPCRQLGASTLPGEPTALEACDGHCVPVSSCGARAPYDGGGGGAPTWPGGRAHHVMWSDAADALWIFGGLGFESTADGTATGSEEQGFMNDLWRYAEGAWAMRGGSYTANAVGVYSVDASGVGQYPGARRSTAVYYDDVDGLLWLFGGQGVAGAPVTGLLNDLWRFDGQHWTFVEGSQLADRYSAFGVVASCDPTDPNALWPSPGEPCTTTDITGGGGACDAINGCTYTPDALSIPGSRREHVIWLDRAQVRPILPPQGSRLGFLRANRLIGFWF